MPRHIHREPHLTDEQLHDRYRRAADLVERSHWHFISAYSPELQPAEHLWPLTNTALANQHFATIEDPELA
jgi:transposase